MFVSFHEKQNKTEQKREKSGDIENLDIDVVGFGDND